MTSEELVQKLVEFYGMKYPLVQREFIVQKLSHLSPLVNLQLMEIIAETEHRLPSFPTIVSHIDAAKARAARLQPRRENRMRLPDLPNPEEEAEMAKGFAMLKKMLEDMANRKRTPLTGSR